jgi:hypothetical protein
MTTFDARLEPRVFWLAVLIPPTVYWIVVEGGVNWQLGGEISFNGLLALTALAYGLPLAALLWVLCSVAAYTIAPGRLIVHRVVGDREFHLDGLLEPAREERRTVLLRWPGRTLRLRPTDSRACLAAISAARGA